VNLGAVTYHYGSKEALYHAVLETASAPLRSRIERVHQIPGAPLDQIEALLRAVFGFLDENPDLPRLVFQQLVTDEPLPPPGLRSIQTGLGVTIELIGRGQRDGSIRPGNGRLLALSIIGQPLLLSIYRRALNEALGIDQGVPEVRRRMVDAVVEFVRAGLASRQRRDA
jgi:AcrR family transcriptional regulator